MNVQRKPSRSQQSWEEEPKGSGTLSWIADELIGIRDLEERLCRNLASRTSPNKRFLISGIQDLNSRVELLDRALDDYNVARQTV